jgi:hypothetical protein
MKIPKNKTLYNIVSLASFPLDKIYTLHYLSDKTLEGHTQETLVEIQG